MAKVNGPFMSLSASGAFANTLVASIWKGRPYMRQLVTPSNPRSAGQVTVRLIIGSLAKAATAVLTSYMDIAGVGSPFFTAARDTAPSGQSWISFLQKALYPYSSAIDSGWTGLGGTKQGYFANAAADAGLVNYVPSFTETAGYVAGKQLYALAYFASNFLTGTIKTTADTAIAGASQGDVDDFGDAVHLTTP